MKHILEQTVYYADTDSYGVVWHGTYIRWMEQGRVEYCRKIGLDLVELKKNNIMIPVTNINLRYKASAKLDDNILIETELTEINHLTVQFTHTIKDKLTGKVFVIGKIEVVAVNEEGKIYRRMPEQLRQACEKGMQS